MRLRKRGHAQASDGVLADVKVADLAEVVARPFGGKMVAAFGAEVVKARCLRSR